LYARLVNIGAGTSDGYAVFFDMDPPEAILICREDNGGLVVLGSSITDFAPSSGDGLGIEVVGNTISAYHRVGGTWTSKGSRTDSTYTAAGKVGFKVNTASVRIDNFGGGTVSGGPAGVLVQPPVRRVF
jgi:hypothetical protein